jgi:hypothetical protein
MTQTIHGQSNSPYCDVVAGGGFKTGQAIGSTDGPGNEAVVRRIHFGEVFASLAVRPGPDLTNATLRDLSGRRHYLVDHRQSVNELT